ncbi:O-unit flippase-like protein [Adlercreutzia sp. ZJ242]|uniref:O-unit flippase-like protein n=1 Tax=Adlercreutzia sp. ZJ242 TaxID=2709409 RepID=UPI0013ED568F|nr:O-unit flippase-like protein [Adlercreutzia sp. ZJ242]
MAILTTKSDIAWGYAGTVLSMTANLLILPFLTTFLSGGYLGLWYVFVSLGALSALFDFGFNPTIARNVTFAWSGAVRLEKKGISSQVAPKTGSAANISLLNRLQKTCRLLYLVVSLVALALLLVVGTPYILFISPELDVLTVLLAWMIYVSALFLNLYYGYFATLLRGIGAVKRYNQILVVSRIVQLTLSVLLLSAGLGIIAPAFAYLSYGFLLRICSKAAFYRYEEIGVGLKKLDEKVSFRDSYDLFKTIWYNAWRDGLVSLSNYLSGQATVVVASVFLTLSETGIYSISVQLITAISTIAAAHFSSSQPAMQSSFACGDLRRLKEQLAVSMAFFLLIYIAMLFLLLSVGVPMLHFFGEGRQISVSVLLCLGIYYIPFKHQQLCASFIAGTNEIPYMTHFVIGSALGVVLSSVFCGLFDLGVWGLVAGQAISQLLYNCWKWPEVAYSIVDTTCISCIKEGCLSLLKPGRFRV